jgi:hypothetical protein
VLQPAPDEDSLGHEAATGAAWSPVSHEVEIIELLDQAAAPGETLELAFRRKERHLLLAFDAMNVRDSMELHRRLRLSLPDDPIAARFARLIAPRRLRLMSFLADARRREAMRSAAR